MTLDDAYVACKKIVRDSGSSFYYGMRLLPAVKRKSMYALYAWSRLCDDAVDEHSGAEAEHHLKYARRILEDALNEKYTQSDNPVVYALGDTIRRYHLSEEPFDGLLEGMRMDLYPTSYQTFEDLREYLERVAGTVGVLSVGIFGASEPAAHDLAVDMGIALQLTNILRDLKEDVLRGRIYLPTEELNRFGYSMEDLQHFRQSGEFHDLMAYQTQRAYGFYNRATRLFPLIETDALRCMNVLYEVYFELLQQIEQNNYDVFSHRIRLSTSRKLWLIGESLWQPKLV